ncbi:hypothetical protein [Castellaniella sp. GW247-6E4]|uniref:hypothetical protein n=1 Tax=Castellaniella sp. GW247-6E4 TaxID=3140380 RepID=UPI00331458DB
MRRAKRRLALGPAPPLWTSIVQKLRRPRPVDGGVQVRDEQGQALGQEDLQRVLPRTVVIVGRGVGILGHGGSLE